MLHPHPDWSSYKLFDSPSLWFYLEKVLQINDDLDRLWEVEAVENRHVDRDRGDVTQIWNTLFLSLQVQARMMAPMFSFGKEQVVRNYPLKIYRTSCILSWEIVYRLRFILTRQFLFSSEMTRPFAYVPQSSFVKLSIQRPTQGIKARSKWILRSVLFGKSCIGTFLEGSEEDPAKASCRDQFFRDL